MTVEGQRAKKKKPPEDERPITEKTWLSLEETALHLNISVGYLYNRTSRKSSHPLPVRPRRIGKLLRFNRLELDAYLMEHGEL